jgi:hypothetical protein
VTRTWTWIALALLAGAALAGGVVVAIDRKRVAQALRDAFEAAGMPGAWGEALGRVESSLSLTATNLSGPDGARGGAWGPTQITERTARAYGYQGPMERLTTDLDFAASFSAQIASAGSPGTVEDLGAWWNAGRRSFDSLPDDHVTRLRYVPRLVNALAEVES